MKILREKQVNAFLKFLKTRLAAGGGVEPMVRKILDDVRRNGDRALKKYTEKFDSVKITSFLISKKELASAADKADKKVVRALELSARRVIAFHKKQKEKSWTFSENGITLGQIIRPIERAGVYIPGGKASYPSTVLMTVIPALLAGVKEIALCMPAPGGVINPYSASAIRMLGLHEIYRIGGAQAIGAMAFGTETIKKVDKIAGPGNIYVATAKRLVFGEVDIDMIAGPSEVLIIADKTAVPSFIAADLLSQAEHDEMASAILITDSGLLAKNTAQELASQLTALKRKTIAKKSLGRYGAIIIVKRIDDAFDIANKIAPEHLEIMTAKPEKFLPAVKHAGAIFLGKWSPEPLGDYSAGPNHTLPTGGTARFSSSLGVYDFVKRSSLIDFKKQGFMRLADTVKTLADAEGLEAHGNTIRVRTGKR
ncbi:MAG: histidinol dehydrogenase [Nitrospirae bacterium]|nr:histidinol dehydrogenase [Nitrospirota bacterium]MBI4839052.1 histidinol dehydrogenase [Nitrospirota bacterium]